MISFFKSIIGQSNDDDVINNRLNVIEFELNEIKKMNKEIKQIITGKSQTIKVLSDLLKREKNDDKTWIIDIIRRFQNSTNIRDKVVLLDGPAPVNIKKIIRNDKKDIYNSVTVNQLIALVPFVNKNHKTSKFSLNKNLYEDIPDPKIMYSYKEYIPSNMLICKKTMRPYYYDALTNKKWTYLSENTYGPLDKQLSAYKYFIDYVCKYKKYPDNNELIIFIFDTINKNAYKKGPVAYLKEYKTLPVCIFDLVNSVIEDYKLATDNFSMDPVEFRNIVINSLEISKRIETEKNS